MEKRRLFMSVCCLFVGLCCYAQQISISGKVVDADGMELPGANVSVKGTQTGTLTDMDGMFRIENVQGGENAVLVISYIGYSTQEVKVGKQRSFSIKMNETDQQLEEVVVVGYGTQKRKDLTGAISQIDNKLIEIQNQSSATKALQGAVPGITYASVDGQPGNDAALRVRGLGSTSTDASNALVVIDGVPAQGDNPLSNMNQQDIATITVLKDAASTAIYGSRGANGVILVTTKKGESGKTKIRFEGRWGVNTVGTYDMGQIDNAAGIYEYVWQSIYNSYRYGVNGTGGPVLGPNGEYVTNINTPNVSDAAAREFASQHLFNYLGSETEFGRNTLGNYMAYSVPGATYVEDGTGTSHSATMQGNYLVGTDGRINPNAVLLYNDTYKDALLKTGNRSDYNLSASGGSEKMDYFVSLGYLSDPSYIPNSKFNRYSGRVKVNSNLLKWLKVGTNVAYSRTQTNYMGTYWQGRNSGSNQGSVLRYVNGHAPIVPVYQHNNDGSYVLDAEGNKVSNYLAGSTYSPLGQTGANYGSTDILYSLNNDVRADKTSTWNTRSYIEIPFLKYFSARADLAYDKINNTTTRYYNGQTGRAASLGGYFGKGLYDTEVLNIQDRLTYNQDIDKHHIDALALYEYSNWEQESTRWGSYDELIANFLSSSNFVGRYGSAGSAPTPAYGHDIERMESVLGRANYIYDNKYYASASIRTDGSSKFKKNRWGTFWSLGGGWRFSEEKFLDTTDSWLTNGKLRASYGVIGNQNAIGRYSGYRTWSYSTLYRSATNGTGTPTGSDYRLSVGGLVNDALTWEKTNTLDIGVDLSFLNRIDVTIDWYNRETQNSFFNQPVSMLAVGQRTLQQNIAKIRNRGIEIDVNADIVRTKDWRWNLSVNASHYTTVLSYLPENAIPAHVEGLPEGTWESYDGMGWSASGDITQSSSFYLRGVGRDWYNIYIYKYAGIDQETGLPLYYHRVTAEEAAAGTYGSAKEGDDVTTNNYAKASKYEMGSAIPDIVGGFNTTVSYKNFSLSAQFAYQIGGKYFSHDYAEYLYSPTYAQSYSRMFVSKEVQGNTWTPENTGAAFPMQWYPTTVNSYFNGTSTNGGNWSFTDLALFNASYLQLKTINLGYTVPKSFMEKIHLKDVSSFRVFVSSDNLFLLSAKKGVDPSMSASGGYGIGAYTFPNMRSFTLGVNLEF